ncbi:phosphopantetheine-binding protein [Streptomyces sp. NPDC006012]|uniref:phosphopantetheine-binding protein n=1 Tax=Streptomyces sp. NPDC006012 TaxID=3364739 RepID=UPI0036CDDBF0
MPTPTWDTVFADVTDMLRSAMGDFDNELVITPESTFRDDIGMESIDIVALAGRLQAAYGNAVNFALFIAGDEAAIATELRVGRLVTYIVDSLKTSDSGSGTSGVTTTTA